MYLRFRQSGKSKDIAGLYFDMGADYYSYGLRIYKQTAAGFQETKDKLMDTPNKAKSVLKQVKANGFNIIGEKYKVNHYPEISEDTLNDFLNRKTFYIAKEEAVNSKVFSSELADEITQGFMQLKAFADLIL